MSEISVEMYKELFPREFQGKFHARGLRSDGRRIDALRQHVINDGIISQADSSCLVKIGNTTVMTAIKLAVGIPRSDTPSNGDFEIHTHLTPLCSTKYTIGRPSEEAHCINSLLTRLLLGSKIIDLRDLGIEEGKSAWKLFVDIYFIDDDGNKTDAAILSVISALKKLSLPETVTMDDGVVRIVPDGNKTVLKLHDTPAPLTLAVMGDQILPDPSSEETKLADCLVTIVCSKTSEQFCMVHKPGGKAISGQDMQKCMHFAKQYAVTIFALYESL